MTDVRDTTVFDFAATLSDGTVVPLDRYRGHVLLIVNVASACGYTPQYQGLERLYQAHRDRGLVVMGFPCNQFGRQEPGTDDQIQAFCSMTYEITFPLFRKIDVNGANAHPLFGYLKAKKKGVLGSASIKWNFTKFLADRAGHVVQRFAPTETPGAIEPAVVRVLDSASSPGRDRHDVAVT